MSKVKEKFPDWEFIILPRFTESIAYRRNCMITLTNPRHGPLGASHVCYIFMEAQQSKSRKVFKFVIKFGLPQCLI